MESSGEIEVARSRLTLSELWEDEFPCLWQSPSSPPYRSPSPAARTCSPSTSRRSAAADQPPSSPSTPSEFEFDPRAVADGRDDPPVSPKFLSSFPAGYWTAARSSSHPHISSSPADFMPAIGRSDGIIDLSKQGPSSPASLGSRSDLDFYSVMQTSPARQTALGLLGEQQDKQEMHAQVGSPARQRKSLGEAMAMAPYPEPAATTARRALGQSKSSIASSSSSSSWFAMHAWDLKNEEERSSASAKKAGPCRSLKRWAFKDLLRRTVPSSKADAHFVAKTFQAPPSPSKFSSSSKHRSTPSSPQASYLSRSHIDSTWRASTLPLVRPSSRTTLQSPSHPSSSSRTTLQSPSYLRSSTYSSSFANSSPTSTHSEAHMLQHSSTPTQTPTASPPRSPISQHVAHYRLQKAQSHELGKKTFLPYRQSLFGCLGGSRAFSSDQLVW